MAERVCNCMIKAGLKHASVNDQLVFHT